MVVCLLRRESTVAHTRLALCNLVNGRVCQGASTAVMYRSRLQVRSRRETEGNCFVAAWHLMALYAQWHGCPEDCLS
jgi:hypothetical protein